MCHQDEVTPSGLQDGISHTMKAGELFNRGNRPLTITQIQHTEQVPANSPLRTFVTIPWGGLLPGEKTAVMASMHPNFLKEDEVQPLLQSSMFQLKVVLQ